MFLGTLDATMLENALAGQGLKRAGEATIRVDHNF